MAIDALRTGSFNPPNAQVAMAAVTGAAPPGSHGPRTGQMGQRGQWDHIGQMTMTAAPNAQIATAPTNSSGNWFLFQQMQQMQQQMLATQQRVEHQLAQFQQTLDTRHRSHVPPPPFHPDPSVVSGMGSHSTQSELTGPFGGDTPADLVGFFQYARLQMGDSAKNWMAREVSSSGKSVHFEGRRTAATFDALVGVLEQLGADSQERFDLLRIMRKLIYELFAHALYLREPGPATAALQTLDRASHEILPFNHLQQLLKHMKAHGYSAQKKAPHVPNTSTPTSSTKNNRGNGGGSGGAQGGAAAAAASSD
jgi:hypothetical protein